MPQLHDASPQLSVRLYKTISRTTTDGSEPVATRYKGKDAWIDLTPYLGDLGSVRTTKGVREPAGAFSITFADKPNKAGIYSGMSLGGALETVYGLVEPMDMVEIRMWHGFGPAPLKLPIVMRGFVSSIARSQTMGQDGKPVRQVVVNGHDYGKIWQTFQVLYLLAYAERKALLTSFNLWEMFGVEAQNTMSAAEFVRQMIKKVINPHLKGLIPENSPMPKEIQTGDSIAVKHGVVNNSYQNMQGSIYDILQHFGDVGVWNELYVEDREDGVHAVYRPTPALNINRQGDPKKRKIQDDAPDPIYCDITDDYIVSLNLERSDSNVANFYWVNNSKFDLIDDVYRKLSAITENEKSVSLKEYPNSAVKFYGIRPMYAETQQGGDMTTSLTSGLPEEKHGERQQQSEAWIEKRRRLMMEMNKDNVVLERGSARVKGGPMRPDGKEMMKAGDYARFTQGAFTFDAYVVQITHEFIPFQGYQCDLALERCEGFLQRIRMEGGRQSPYLVEMMRRGYGGNGL